MSATQRPWDRLSIAQIVLLVFLAAVCLLGVSLFTVSNSLIKTVVLDQASREARLASEFVFQGLYKSMSTGWDELEIEKLISRAQQQLPGAQVTLVRGQAVAGLFGPALHRHEPRRLTTEVASVLTTGQEIIANDGRTFDFIYPFLAEAECLRCHTNAQPGDVNGIAHISIPLDTLSLPLRTALGRVIKALVVLTIVALLAQFVVVRRILVRPITALTAHILEMRRTKELDRHALAEDEPLGFLELRLLAQSFDTLMEDVSRTQDQLREQSERDDLTGLLNRRSFNRMIKHEISRAERYDRPLAVFLIDLDGFKQVNDTYGHIIGDAVLRRSAKRLAQNVRQNDVVARLGGDELVVAAPEMDRESAHVFKEKLRHLLEQSDNLSDGSHVKIGASVGLALYPGDGKEPRDLLAHADKDMYKEKRARKDEATGSA